MVQRARVLRWISGFVFYGWMTVAGLTLILWTCTAAAERWGYVGAVVAFVLVGISEVVMAIIEWVERGFTNPLTLLVTVSVPITWALAYVFYWVSVWCALLEAEEQSKISAWVNRDRYP